MVGHDCMERGGHTPGTVDVRPNSMETCPRKSVPASPTFTTVPMTQNNTGFSNLYWDPHSAFTNEPGLSADHRHGGGQRR